MVRLGVYDLLLLLKPKVLLAMTAIYAFSYIISFVAITNTPFQAYSFFVGFIAVFTAVGGSNALNCYIERDIDAVMTRTMSRPIPRGTVKPVHALASGLLLLISAAFISMSLGVYQLLLFSMGVWFYIVVYTMFLKRKTPLNVLATAPSVAAPAWFGWLMGGSPFNLQALILGLFVAVWGLLHLWSIAYVFDKDYSRCNIPMLPVVASPKIAVYTVFASLLLLFSYSLMLGLWAKTPAYVLIISIINVPFLLLGLRFLRVPTKRNGWLLFKLSAPYILVILAALTMDNLLNQL